MLRAAVARLLGRPLPDDPAPTPHSGGGGLALALTGGGARAAYQAGVLRGLVRAIPSLEPRILTGVSAGALNGAFLAAAPAASFSEAVDALVETWTSITAEDVYRVDGPSLTRTLARLVRRPAEVDPPAEGGLLDTTPLHAFVERHLGPLGAPIEAIGNAVEAGRLHAFAVTTTSYTTGQSVTWVEGRGEEIWDRPMRRAVRARILPEHILASASLPFFFPAVEVQDAAVGPGWYGDGGIRLTAPLSPALHLGADRILAINTRYARSSDEANRPDVDAYPLPARVLGVLMNAVFLDVLDRDAQTLQRINALLEVLPADEWNGFRPVDLIVLRPSRDLATLASGFEPRLPPTMRLLLGGLGVADRSPDWLSMLLFDPAYVQLLLEVGEADGDTQAESVAAFLDA